MHDPNGQVTVETVKQMFGEQVKHFTDDELEATVQFINRSGGVSQAVALLSDLEELRKVA